MAKLAGVLVCFFVIPTLRCVAAQYTVTDLGTLGDSASQACAINNLGQVVGFSATSGHQIHGFLYDHGQMQDLGFGGIQSNAADINDLGQVVGSVSSGVVQYSFVYSSGSKVEFPTTTFLHLNNHGVFVGYTGEYHAAAMSNGNVQELGTLGGVSGESMALSVNDTGVIVGISQDTAGNFHAVTFFNGSISDLGIPPDGHFAGADINAAGQIVCTIGGQAYFYSNGSAQPLNILGLPFSDAEAINDVGQIVGYASSASSTVPYIFADGTAQDLNTLISSSSGWTLTFANDINNLGQIVGQGTYLGQARAFLLTPVTDSIPEPTSLWLLVLASVALFPRRAAGRRLNSASTFGISTVKLR
jgi:probable HAF family extracellular repeat protein